MNPGRPEETQVVNPELRYYKLLITCFLVVSKIDLSFAFVVALNDVWSTIQSTKKDVRVVTKLYFYNQIEKGKSIIYDKINVLFHCSCFDNSIKFVKNCNSEQREFLLLFDFQ